MNDVSVDIGQVVVHVDGGGPTSPAHFGRLTEHALGQLLERHGLPPGWRGGELGDVIAPSISLPPGTDDERLADELARALYRSLGGPER